MESIGGIPGLIGALLLALFGGGAFWAFLGPIILKKMGRKREKVEIEGQEIKNEQERIKARHEGTQEEKEKAIAGEELYGRLEKRLKEGAQALEKQFELQSELSSAKIMLQVEERDNQRLREDLQKFWMAEGGCLERERMLTEQIRESERKHKDEIGKLKIDYQNQIDDIKIQLEEALGYKDKNIELAEENSRLLAKIEAKPAKL